MGQPSKAATLKIKGDLDIFSIHVQAESLRSQMSIPGSHTVDLKEVGDVDMSGFQLLLAVYHQVRASGGRFKLVGVSTDLRHRMEDLGFMVLLGGGGA